MTFIGLHDFMYRIVFDLLKASRNDTVQFTVLSKAAVFSYKTGNDLFIYLIDTLDEKGWPD